MIHCFDVDIARVYGVNCAVILQNIYYWIEKNEANGSNFYNNTYWTYNSTKAFKKLFPYLSERQINSTIAKLYDEGLILKDKFNENKYDHTTWYALSKKGKSIMQKCKIEYAEMSNRSVENVKSSYYTNINTDINTDINTQSQSCSEIQNLFNVICKSYPKVKTLSDARKKTIKARFKTYNVDDFKSLFELAENSDFLKGKNNSNWQANFDWLIKDANMAKVLDGNYNEQKKQIKNYGQEV